MTKAENSRVAQSNEPSADRIAADLANLSRSVAKRTVTGGGGVIPAAPVCCSACGQDGCVCSTCLASLMATRKPTLTVHQFFQVVNFDPANLLLRWEARPLAWFHAGKKQASACASWNAQYAGAAIALSTNSSGYTIIRVKGRKYPLHRIVFAHETGSWPDQDVDHINGDRSDNSRSNLRLVSRGDNNRNRRVGANQSGSGTLGVFWRERYRCWVAGISDNGKPVFLGHFTDKEKAVAARKDAERRLGYHPNHGRASA